MLACVLSAVKFGCLVVVNVLACLLYKPLALLSSLLKYERHLIVKSMFYFLHTNIVVFNVFYLCMCLAAVTTVDSICF